MPGAWRSEHVKECVGEEAEGQGKENPLHREEDEEGRGGAGATKTRGATEHEHGERRGRGVGVGRRGRGSGQCTWYTGEYMLLVTNRKSALAVIGPMYMRSSPPRTSPACGKCAICQFAHMHLRFQRLKCPHAPRAMTGCDCGCGGRTRRRGKDLQGATVGRKVVAIDARCAHTRVSVHPCVSDRTPRIPHGAAHARVRCVPVWANPVRGAVSCCQVSRAASDSFELTGVA